MKAPLNTAGFAFDNLVFIGRMQLFHNGQLSVIRKALTMTETLIIVLGSAFKPRTVRNPFFASEREAMIKLALGADASRVKFVHMPDFHDNEKWKVRVESSVEALCTKDSKVGIIGHDKDETSFYLHMFRNWEQVLVDNFENINATDLRNLYFVPKEGRAASHALLETRVPQPVREFLAAFAKLPEFEQRVLEFTKLMEAKATTPANQIFVTVDAVVECNDYVLMVKRKSEFGNDLWALCGVFLDTKERLKAAALRALDTKANLNFTDAYLDTLLKDSEVFDFPGRSERGRVISHSFHYRLTSRALPDVTPGGNASETRWIHKSDLPKMQEVIYEDHLSIIDRYIPVL